MSARGAVAFAAGASVACALSGACTALTALPPWTLLVAGLVLALAALRGGGENGGAATARACAAAGLICGALVPATAPPAPGGMVSRAPGGAYRGDLFEALDELDADPAAIVGRRISVSGDWTPASGSRSATVSRRIVSCCAADAIAVGFDVDLARRESARSGSWVRVTGVVREGIVDGDVRYVLEHSALAGLEDSDADAR